MGKLQHKDTTETAHSMEISAQTPASMSSPALSTGELGQLQEILYGAQQRATHDQIASLENKINEQIQTLSNMLNSRVNQLTESIDKTSKAHEQQLRELKAEHNESTKTLSKNIDDKNTELVSSISLLGKSTGTEATRFNNELKNTEALLQTQLRETREALQLEIKASADQLQSKKLDTQNLAQLLGNISEQLSKSDSAKPN